MFLNDRSRIFLLRDANILFFFETALLNSQKNAYICMYITNTRIIMTQDIKTEKTRLDTQEQKRSDLPDLGKFDFPEDYDVWEDENLDMIP